MTHSTDGATRRHLRRFVAITTFLLALLLSAPMVSGTLTGVGESPASAADSCDATVASLTADVAAFEGKVAAYNAEVDALNAAGGGSQAQVAAYDSRKAALIAEGNAIVAKTQQCQSEGVGAGVPKPTLPGQPAPPQQAPNASPATPRGPPAQPAPKPAAPRPSATQPSAPKASAPAQSASQPPVRALPPSTKQTIAPQSRPSTSSIASQPPRTQSPSSAAGGKAPEPVDYGATPEQRLQNPQFQKRFYDSLGRRKDKYDTDDFGNPLPQATIDGSGRWRVTDKKVDVPAGRPTSTSDSPPQAVDRAMVDPIAKERTAAIEELNDVKGRFEGEVARNGQASPEVEGALRAAHDRVTKAGAEFGEVSARAAFRREYPADRFDVRELTDPNHRGGAGEPDQVYLVTPRGGGEPYPVLVEAKAPGGELTSRMYRGQRVEQATEEYARSIAEAIQKSNPTAAAALRNGLNNGSLKSLVIRAKVRPDGAWNGATVARY